MSRPVLLIHGFLSVKAAMIPLQRQLKRKGHDARRVSLSPLCLVDVRRLAQQVAAEVSKVGGPVDLVGVSQGGLAALTYMRMLDGHQHVRRLVTIGTPFQGSWMAAAGVPFLGLVSKGVWQSLPDSDFLAQLRAQPAPNEDIVSISKKGDVVSPPHRCVLPGARHVVLARGMPGAVHQRLALSAATAAHVHDALVFEPPAPVSPRAL